MKCLTHSLPRIWQKNSRKCKHMEKRYFSRKHRSESGNGAEGGAAALGWQKGLAPPPPSSPDQKTPIRRHHGNGSRREALHAMKQCEAEPEQLSPFTHITNAAFITPPPKKTPCTKILFPILPARTIQPGQPFFLLAGKKGVRLAPKRGFKRGKETMGFFFARLMGNVLTGVGFVC